MDKVFASLASHHRREIIYALGLQPHSISQLASMRGLSLPAIHKHLKVLEDAKLISRKKIGQTNFISLNRKPLRDLQEWVMQYHPYWGADNETLENYNEYLEKKSPPALKMHRGKKGGEKN